MNYPAVSSNTLFHFTSERKYLLSILENNFQPRYCFEILSGAMAKTKLPDWWNRGIPMTCFCDLTLSNTSKHLATYGDYGLGLTKEWGQKNGITPVLYVHKDSPLIECVKISVATLEQSLIRSMSGNDDDVLNRIADGLKSLIDFTKPYKGNFKRKGKLVKNVRFYDEREWRYVPQNAPVLSEVDMQDTTLLKQVTDEIWKSSTLEFSPNDIKYIIVKEESEILELYEEIKRIKSPKYTADEIKKLQTRIISAQQIREDF